MPPQHDPTQRVEDPEHNEHLQEFYKFYKKQRMRSAISPDDAPKFFFPVDALKGYLSLEFRYRTQRLLEKLLPDETIDPQEIGLITNQYPCVFAILLLEGCGRYILSFLRHRLLADRYLPFNGKPPDFPESPSKDLFELFRKRQWEFCAPNMEPGRSIIQDECVLPITEKDYLDRGVAANTFKIKIHPSYNDLDLKAGINKDDFLVMKVSDSLPTSNEHFDQEIEGFSHMKNALEDDTSAIVTYYGSFRHAGRFYILLEHADGGNLEDLLSNTDLPRPRCDEDIAELWHNLFALVRGLSSIHSHRMDYNIKNRDVLQGWHQDIKPRNILVVDFCKEAPWKSHFRLADLGLSHFQPLDSQRYQDDSVKPGIVASQAARTYGAPECYEHGAPNSSKRQQPDKASDVWSLGAVFSEVAVWIASGPNGLDNYRWDRYKEIHCKGTCRHYFAFHDGNETLDCVKAKHAKLRQRSDPVTSYVLTSVISQMLWPDVQDRSATGLLHGLWVQFYRQFKAGQTYEATDIKDTYPTNPTQVEQRNISDQPGSALNSPASQHSDFQPPASSGGLEDADQAPLRSEPPQACPREVPEWDYPSALQWDSDRKASQYIDPEPLGIHSPRLCGRDHCLLIDNSPSMRDEWHNVRQNAELLINILFYFHADKAIDLCFMNGPDAYRFPRESAYEFVKAIDGKKPRERQAPIFYEPDPAIKLGMMLKSHQKRAGHGTFKRILDWVRGEPLKPLSIYVLTDGQWHSKETTELLIREMVSEHPQLRDRDTGEAPAIGIQFIRFGTSEQARKDLDHLDAGLDLPRDIVDTEPWNGNVAKMLLGPISRRFDNDPTRIDMMQVSSPTSYAPLENDREPGHGADDSLPQRSQSGRYTLRSERPTRRSQYGSGRR